MIPLTQFGQLFTAVMVVLILVLPRKWATAPLLIGVFYMVLSQGLVIGPFNFFVIRLLVLAGAVRVFLRREWLPSGLNKMDWLMIAWATWALAASFFRENPTETLINQLGITYNACGVYFLLRVFVTSSVDVKRLCCIVSVLLIPIAFEMFREQITGHNLFSVLGGVPEQVVMREGRLRSQGPFAHPILAGTVGAIFLPVAIILWRFHRVIAIGGSIACCIIVFTSASSGPLLSAMLGLFALTLWKFRRRMRLFRWGAVFAYVGLSIIMTAPVYFLLARISVIGGSTAWHRAELIDAGIRYFSEWWLAGTDYTRHWMPTGVTWSANHTDITNYYLRMGVDGGLLLLVLFVAIMWAGFTMVGKAVQSSGDSSPSWALFYWALGASLFAHAATSISVSYFDQSFALLYLTLAAISAVNEDISRSALSCAPGKAERSSRESKRWIRQPLGVSPRAHRRETDELRER